MGVKLGTVAGSSVLYQELVTLPSCAVSRDVESPGTEIASVTEVAEVCC